MRGWITPLITAWSTALMEKMLFKFDIDLGAVHIWNCVQFDEKIYIILVS